MSPKMRLTATVFAAIVGVFIIYVGIGFLTTPQSSASGYGAPSWPEDQGTAFLAVKGVRDIGTGLVVFALLLNGHRKALGWALLAFAFIPLGDMSIVLEHHGATSTAFGVHGGAALFVIVSAVLLLREAPHAAGVREVGVAPAQIRQ